MHGLVLRNQYADNAKHTFKSLCRFNITGDPQQIKLKELIGGIGDELMRGIEHDKILWQS